MQVGSTLSNYDKDRLQSDARSYGFGKFIFGEKKKMLQRGDRMFLDRSNQRKNKFRKQNRVINTLNKKTYNKQKVIIQQSPPYIKYFKSIQKIKRVY